MQIGGTGRLDEQSRAAAEAARRAAQEAARRAAEEAARRAAEQAAAEAARKQAALQQAVAMEREQSQIQSNPAWRASRMDYGDMPFEQEPQFPTLTAEDLKADPALGAQLGALKDDPDPQVRAYVRDTAQQLMEATIEQSLERHHGDAVFDHVQDEMAELTQLTGLQEAFGEASQDAVRNVAERMLDRGVSPEDLDRNPAIGRVLASLQDSEDPAVQERLGKTLEGWARATLDRELAGAEGEGEVKEAMARFEASVRELSEASGLVGPLEQPIKEALRDRKGEIERRSDIGKNWLERRRDDIGDFMNNLLDIGGDLFRGGTQLVGAAANGLTDALAAGVRRGTALAGDVADTSLDLAGLGAELLADGAARSLDAMGAETAANRMRTAGDVANRTLDRTGDYAEATLDVVGEANAVALDKTGDLAEAGAAALGRITDRGFDLVGDVLDDGPLATADRLAEGVLGPEHPAHMGEIDGYTGVITNRLGRGDSVFLSVEAGAKVGVAAFAGATLTGAAVLGRNGDGHLTLTLAVGGEVETGVSTKTGVEANGVGASADAKASVSAEAEGKVTLTFDPANSEDVARLKALTEPDVSRLAQAATNPLSLASPSEGALAQALAHNLTSTEIGTSVSAGVSARAGVGVEDVASARAGISASATAGTTDKFNADGTQESKTYIRAGVKMELSAEIGGMGARAGFKADGLEAFSVRTGPDGEIIGLKAEYRGSASASVSASGPGMGALSEGESTKFEQSLTPEGLAAATRLIADGASPTDAFAEVADQPGMSEVHRSTTTTDSFTLGVDVKAGLAGVQVGVDASATVGKSHTEFERYDDPDLTDLDDLILRPR